MIKEFKKAATTTKEKVSEVADEVKETNSKIQDAISESSKSVQTMFNVGTVALCIDAAVRLVTLFTTLKKHKQPKCSSIVIENLYLTTNEPRKK